MPEQSAISIKASIAPEVAGGLHAIVGKVMADTTSRPKPKAGREAPRTIVNKHTGPVDGTLFQIGNVQGDVHNHRPR